MCGAMCRVARLIRVMPPLSIRATGGPGILDGFERVSRRDVRHLPLPPPAERAGRDHRHANVFEGGAPWNSYFRGRGRRHEGRVAGHDQKRSARCVMSAALEMAAGGIEDSVTRKKLERWPFARIGSHHRRLWRDQNLLARCTSFLQPLLREPRVGKTC